MDNHPGILDFRYSDGSSIWLSLRFTLRMMNFRILSGDDVEETKYNKITRKKILAYMLHTWKNNPWKNKEHTDILSVANYEENPAIPNWWTAFLQEIPELSRKELLYSHKCLPFPEIRNTYSLDYFLYKSIIKRKIFRKGRKTNNLRIAEFAEYLHSELKDYLEPSDFRQLNATMHFVDSVSIFYRRELKKYLSAVMPRLLVCSEGNNGDWRYNILFSVAHELGISSAEVQHGAMGLGMNFGNELIKNQEFRKHKTTYLFTFGPYHNYSTNAAKKNISFGHYRLEKIRGRITDKRAGNKLKILFICEGIPPSAKDNLFVRTVSEALEQFGEAFELVVRLHPTENPNTKYDSLMAFPNSRYSNFKDEDIYPLIMQTDLIIGHTSTVLFEAVYFDKIPLIYRDAMSEEYIPENLGSWFGNAQELLHFLMNRDAIKDVKNHRDMFWATGSTRENFLNFWNKILAGTAEDEMEVEANGI